MTIQHEDDGRRGRFFMEGDGSLLAEIVYSWNDTGDLVIHHTNVDALLEGRGIGKALVAQTVTLARERHSRIIPLCPFAKAILNRTPEWQTDAKKELSPGGGSCTRPAWRNQRRAQTNRQWITTALYRTGPPARGISRAAGTTRYIPGCWLFSNTPSNPSGCGSACPGFLCCIASGNLLFPARAGTIGPVKAEV